MPSKYSGYHRLSKISKREASSFRHSSRRKRSPSSDRKEIRKTPWDYGRSGSSDKKIFDVMEIPFNLVPFVIGIFGHRIKEIQADSGCQIKIHSDITSNGTHICNFYGRKSNIENAQKMINDIVKLYPTTGVTGKDEKIVLSYSKVIKIPSNKCGFIVGENGEILKNLQMKYNVEMKIICQRVSRGTKLLHITGSKRNVKDACDEVENIINDISSTALVVPREAVGPIMGKCGQNLMWFSSKSGCKINLEPLESPNATEQSAILHGTVQQIANAIHMISKLLRYCSKNVEKHSGYFHVGFDELEKIVG
uniref:K Homology domain-containing protein n=1 Tax=Panagrolaimus sp. PS1159 TaxID=55785 RepID=A0AC35GC21_9BILA